MLYFFPASLTLNNVGTEQNYILSKSDVLWITNVYNNKNTNEAVYFYKSVYNDNITNSDIEKINTVSLTAAPPSNNIIQFVSSTSSVVGKITIILFFILIIMLIFFIIKKIFQ